MINVPFFLLGLFLGSILFGSIVYCVKNKRTRTASFLLGSASAVILAWGILVAIEFYCCSCNELSMMEQGHEGNMPTAYQSWVEEGRVIIH